MDPRTVYYTTSMNAERASVPQDHAAPVTDSSLSAPGQSKFERIPCAGGAHAAGLGQTNGHESRSWREDEWQQSAPRGNQRSLEESLELQPVFLPQTRKALLLRHLQLWPLRLILKPATTRQHPPDSTDYFRWVSGNGLDLKDAVRRQFDPPEPRFPLLVATNQSPSAQDGEIGLVAHGNLLEEVWPGLTRETKDRIAGQLRQCVGQIRKTRQGAMPRFLGSASSGEYSLLLDEARGTTHCTIQSIPTHRHFIKFLIATLRPEVPVNVATSVAAQFPQSGPLVLSHCGLSPGNIIVNQGTVVGIIDWKSAGSYPEWWEYVKFFQAETQHQDWFGYASTDRRGLLRSMARLDGSVGLSVG